MASQECHQSATKSKICDAIDIKFMSIVQHQFFSRSRYTSDYLHNDIAEAGVLQKKLRM
jgi:hypothetical protein